MEEESVSWCRGLSGWRFDGWVRRELACVGVGQTGQGLDAGYCTGGKRDACAAFTGDRGALGDRAGICEG